MAEAQKKRKQRKLLEQDEEHRKNYQEAMEALEKEVSSSQSDRAAAIIVGCMVEEWIARLILAGLNVDKEEKSDILFDYGSGLLKSYNPKIEMALALGLIGRKMSGQLRIIGRIRNEFAHTLELIMFDTNIIQKHLQKLDTHEMLNYVRRSVSPLPKQLKFSTSREKFMHDAKVIIGSLSVGTNHLRSKQMTLDRESAKHVEVVKALAAFSVKPFFME